MTYLHTGDLKASLPSEALSNYRQHGYCVVRGLFSPVEVTAMSTLDVDSLRDLAERDAEVRKRIQFRPLPDGGMTIQKLEAVHRMVPDLEHWCRDPRLQRIAEELMGESAVLFKDKYILKPRGAGGFGEHQDMTMGFHRFVSGCISIMIAIDPATPENGCLEVASIRHTPEIVSRPEHQLCHGLVPADAWEQIPLQPGDIAVFDGLTPHRSAPNETDDLRRVLILTWAPAADGDCYDAYYHWYFSWQAHIASGGQRIDYPGVPLMRSRQGIRSFADSA